MHECSCCLLQIVELLNAVYCLAELTEFAAFVWLRIAAPELHRPYRVPLPTWACAIMLLPASALLLTLLALPILRLDWLVGPCPLSCVPGCFDDVTEEALWAPFWCSLHWELRPVPCFHGCTYLGCAQIVSSVQDAQ